MSNNPPEKQLKQTLLDRLRKSGFKWLRDLLLIVASILIAFSLDAWWSRSVEADRLEARADGLITELQASEEALSQYIHDLKGSLNATGVILSTMGTTDEYIQLDWVRARVAESMDVETLRPRLVSLDSMLANGELNRLDPEELQALENWRKRILEVEQAAEALRRNRDVDFVSTVMTIGYPLSQLVAAPSLGIPQSNLNADVTTVFESTEIDTVFTMRAVQTRFLITESTEVKNEIDGLIGILDASF